MTPARISAIFHTARLGLRIRLAQRRERDALARAGEVLAASEDVSADNAPQGPLDEVGHIRLQLDALSKAISLSLEADRADYVAVSRWIRPVVIVRGLCARMVLRHHLMRCRRALRPLYEALGAVAMAKLAGERARLGVSAGLADTVRAAQAEREAAAAERALRLTPFHGAALPVWISGLADEGKALGKTLGKQVRDRLFPRASALAGLAAGWWIANTYTHSHWRAALRSLGIGRGGTQVVSAETYQAMSFWLPILSAAICAYLGGRIALFLRRRYEPREIPQDAACSLAAPSGSRIPPSSRAAA